jgi:inner membrane protein
VNPATHFLAGWLIANVDHLERRDRALVTLAGVVPDADGLGILAGAASRDPGAGLALYGQYHHVLAHNVFFGALLAVSVYAFSKKKTLAAFLAFFGFHLHLVGDLLSGRGLDGTIWDISYLFPVLRDVQFSWSGQWELNAWPNVVITAAALIFTFYLAWRRGFSPVSLFSLRADRVFIETLRRRFPKKGAV